MKAKKVYEALEFERGKDPKKTMRIGKSNLLRPGAILKVIHKLPVISLPVGAFMLIEDTFQPDERGIEISWRRLNKKLDYWEGPGIFTGLVYITYTDFYDNLDFVKFNIDESVNFERGKDPKESLNLGLVNFIREELRRIGLTREVSIPIVSPSGGVSIGKTYQFTDENMANMAEYRDYDNGEDTLTLLDSEENLEHLEGPGEIYDFVKSGKMEKFFNLENY
jgi:hypothetical protein